MNKRLLVFASLVFFWTSSVLAQSPPRVTFKEFRSYDLTNKKYAEALKALNGKKIKVIGFMMPFDSIEKIDRFMFLQAPFQGCFHLPPPQAHETLMVESGKLNISYDQYPLELEGILNLKETVVEGFLVSVYTITATAIKRAEMKDLESTGLPPGAHFSGDF
jgi:hypothetical protein